MGFAWSGSVEGVDLDPNPILPGSEVMLQCGRPSVLTTPENALTAQAPAPHCPARQALGTASVSEGSLLRAPYGNV